MDAAARRAVRRWDGSPVVDIASEMSAIALDVAGRALFGADLTALDPSLGRALAAGQRMALLGALLPLPWGPVTTRAARAAARRLGARAARPVERLISGPPRLEDDGRRDLLGLLATARDTNGSGLSELVHRNPAVWPNPSGFDPGRFLPGAPERHRYAWIPFGGGKRGCVGAGFARQEAVLVLARLCRHYRLDLVSPGLPRPRGLVTLRPAAPVPMRLARRG